MTRDEIENLIEQLDRPVDWAHFAGDDYALDYQELQQEAATALRSLLNPWRPIEEAPLDRLIIFAVPVFRSKLCLDKPGEFLVWNAWVDDPSGDWNDVREIGWRMADATLWCDRPPIPAPAEGRSKGVPDTASHDQKDDAEV